MGSTRMVPVHAGVLAHVRSRAHQPSLDRPDELFGRGGAGVPRADPSGGNLSARRTDSTVAHDFPHQCLHL
jgi:hypothetical protein